MTDQEYQVVFRGEILPSKSVEEAKANLAALYKTDVTRIERLFSGKAMVLKKGVSREAGERYRGLLEKAGIACDLLPAGVAAPPPPPAEKTPAEQPEAVPPANAGKPGLKQAAAVMKEKVKAVQAGDLNQAMGTITEKVREIDAEETGRKVASMVGGATAAVKADFQKGGVAALKQNKVVWAAAGAAVLIVVAIVMMVGGGAKPLPIDSSAFSRFEQQYNREVRKLDLGTARTTTLIGLAREVIDDMGYDFDRTLLLWLMHKDRVENQGAMNLYTNILVEPVAVAVSADLSGIGELIAPETRAIFQKTADLPQGVDLLPIRMVKACPAKGNLLKQADMLKILEDNAVTINPAQPDMTIADTFFGLERAGFIKIHRRWDDDTQFSDIEILDMEAMNTIEDKLVYMENMRKEFAGN